jgi:uncharacterized membrane protein YagU involved in acid resistance
MRKKGDFMETVNHREAFTQDREAQDRQVYIQETRSAKQPKRSALADAVIGAAAGVAASWVMGKATSYLYERESEETRKQEKEARGGKMAYGVAAEKAAELAGTELSDEQRKKYGSAIHWGLGVGAGAAYGAMRLRVPGVDWGRGLGFGLAFWLLVDEAGNTALGLTPPPQAFPWETHARGIAGHLVFGVVTEAVFQLTDELT